ncbi:MAG: metal-dependent hydrolase [Thioclava marina]|uniref:metal-dependent hydrolase n=1 Tax=Thioclava marina TaxID=1915077 RepID=UPI0019AD2536|nr:metal-dependent hydrolase [Thioclava marina]MBC7146624.1 metal-dependent hydrolase [Thioclava marina]
MKLIWLGHSGFRIESGDAVILLDPFLTGSPVFPHAKRDEAIKGATHVLLTHGHGDHASDAASISKELGIPVYCIHEMSIILGKDGAETVGFGKGGTVDLNGVKVTMVNATHSASIDYKGGDPIYAGQPAGFMIEAEGHTIYVTGDTDVMADMEWMGELHNPDIGIIAAGGHYTMDMKRAAWAAKKYFNFKTVIPCHYKTFPLLEQSAQPLADALPGVDVIEPEILKVIEI